MRINNKILVGFTMLLLSSASSQSFSATLEQDVVAKLNDLRTIKAEGSTADYDRYNKLMDSAWSFFIKSKTQVQPILREQLKAELAQKQPNQLILLDIGYFVYGGDDPQNKAVALDALEKVNPATPIVKANHKELFEFAHAVARAHDPRVLPIIEKAFLPSDTKVFIPQHSLTLDGTLICVFLYGAYGPESEDILRAKLKDKAVSTRALETLIWLGTPASLPDVKVLMAGPMNYETFARITGYMMQSGGPAGKEAMLAVDEKKLDAKSVQYYAKVKPDIQKTSFDTYKAAFTKLPGTEKKLPDQEVKARLAAMVKNFGKDDKTHPLALLESGVDSGTLISELVKIRGLMLHRLSDEALSDVEITNSLINGLRFRGK